MEKSTDLSEIINWMHSLGNQRQMFLVGKVCLLVLVIWLKLL